MSRRNGFTLIEMMIVVGIVAILASIALPAYNDYVRRGRIAKAVSTMSSQGLRMEQYFQDNRKYSGACSSTTDGTVAPLPASTSDWSYPACSPISDTSYTFTAVGQGPMTGFSYAINEKGTHMTLALPNGWSGAVGSSASTCWVLKKDGSC